MAFYISIFPLLGTMISVSLLVGAERTDILRQPLDRLPADSRTNLTKYLNFICIFLPFFPPAPDLLPSLNMSAILPAPTLLFIHCIHLLLSPSCPSFSHSVHFDLVVWCLLGGCNQKSSLESVQRGADGICSNAPKSQDNSGKFF